MAEDRNPDQFHVYLPLVAWPFNNLYRFIFLSRRFECNAALRCKVGKLYDQQHIISFTYAVIITRVLGQQHQVRRVAAWCPQ